jgi:hypothetical protein
MTRSSRLTATLLLGAAAAMALSACGQVGALEQPAPLYGAKAKADYQARKAAQAAADKASKDDGEAEPLAPDTPGVDQSTGATPTLREEPGPGMKPSPDPAPPPGVLPDPSATHPPQ